MVARLELERGGLVELMGLLNYDLPAARDKEQTPASE